MKYSEPKYNLSALETKDIILASMDKYEITKNDNGTGNVMINANEIF